MLNVKIGLVSIIIATMLALSSGVVLADNVKPSTAILCDEDGDGIFDTANLTFYTTGPWIIKGYRYDMTVTLANGSGPDDPKSGKTTKKVVIGSRRKDPYDYIKIWSHDYSGGQTTLNLSEPYITPGGCKEILSNDKRWEHTGKQEIPEFSTIAIPAAAVLVMIFLMSRRKRKE